MASAVGVAPSPLLPSPSSVHPRGFLHAESASSSKLNFFLPLPASAIITKLRHKRVNVSPLCELGLQSEPPSECTAEASLASSSSSSSASPSPNLTSERGIFFSTGPSFFRAQSSLGRDLAVLAAALYKRSQGRLRVLDAMSGCGVRALRYLTQSAADFVVANDCNVGLHTTVVENLSRYAPLQGLHCPPEPFIRSDNPREPCRTDDLIRSGYTGNSIKIESHSSTVNLSNIDNPSSQAGQLSVDAGSFECNGSPAPELISSAADNFCRINVSSRSLENQSISREGEKNLLEARNFDHNGSPATESRSLTSSINTCFTEANTPLNFDSSSIKWQVCHEEAMRLLNKCNLNMDFYDFIDVDSFGSDSFFIGPALSALRFGGLLFVTCTDGFSSGGHRPYNSLAQYGTFMKPMPYANELGLRMLMGAVVKEASLRNMTVSPIFSVYAPHGPVFRVLLRASAGKLSKNMHYRFIYYCGNCGDSNTVDWERLGTACCPCSETVPDCIKMSGPLWTGPLHNAKDIQDMIALAKEWGWISDVVEAESLSSSSGGKRKKKQEKLLELLNLMLEESHPELPFGYIHLDEIAKRAKIQTPRREKLIQALRNDGYVVSRSHICPNAVKTNCSMTSCIALAKRLADTGF